MGAQKWSSSIFSHSREPVDTSVIDSPEMIRGSVMSQTLNTIEGEMLLYTLLLWYFCFIAPLTVKEAEKWARGNVTEDRGQFLTYFRFYFVPFYPFP